MSIKVFSIVDPDKADDIIKEWMDETESFFSETIEVISICQSETSSGNFYHLTITVVWQFKAA